MSVTSNVETTGLEIAVIGMSVHLPGADDIERFWKNLENGVESIAFASDDELEQSGMKDETIRNPAFVPVKGGLLANRQSFDASFFGFTPREAELLNPQTRLLLHGAWEALEDAGYNPFSYKGYIGLYGGAGSGFHWNVLVMMSGIADEIGEFAAMLLADERNLCTHVAYKLDLKGPAVLVQSACSTSLVAVHYACQGILNGECDLALAGGVTVFAREPLGYIYRDGMVNSPDGHCRAFDRRAKGMVGGEGAGVAVLKRCAEALEQGDHIYAVIKGSAVNNDGLRKVGYTAPSIQGQAEVIRVALQVAEVEPETVTYIEAHGTGTSLGDPVEIGGLIRAFDSEKRQFCAIGSVKTNVGHLDAAAGIVSFIKTVLALARKKIPANLHFEEPNPNIQFASSPFYVNPTLKDWQTDGFPLRAGVSSFGIGGTNAHVVLEEAPVGAMSASGASSRPWRLMTLSAASVEALDKSTQRLSVHLAEHPNLSADDVAFTLHVGRREMPVRRMLVCDSLKNAAAGLARAPVATAPSGKPSVVFLFPGLGSQYSGMGRGLYGIEPEFRRQMDRCAEIVNDLLNIDIKGILYSTESAMQANDIAQVCTFIVEYSLAKLLMSWGILPSALLGYSFGEYAAACLAGVFSLEDALGMICWRGELMGRLPEGTMLSVPLATDDVLPMLGDELSLAIDNGASCVVAGTTEAVSVFAALMKERRLFCTYIETNRAVHSHMMAGIQKEFESRLRRIQFHPPNIPYISNVTGRWADEAEVQTPSFWSRQLRETAQFAAGARCLLEEGDAIYLEVGPGRECTALMQRFIGRDSQVRSLNLLRHPQKEEDDWYYLLTKIGQFWLAGGTIDWQAYHGNEIHRRVSLPTYPFECGNYWIQSRPNTIAPTAASPLKNWFYIPSWKQSPMLPNRKPLDYNGFRLLFLATGSPASALADQWRRDGDLVWTVEPSDGFTRKDSTTFTLDPAEPADYVELLETAQAEGVALRHIIHAWLWPGGPEDGDLRLRVDGFLPLAFASLVYIAQALRKTRAQGSIQVDTIGSGLVAVLEGDSPDPAKALVMGPLRVIPQEYPFISCRCVDLDAGDSNRKLLKRELALHPQEPLIALRSGNRFAPHYLPLELPEPDPEALPLKERGVYLLTGGLGAIGGMIAEFLARDYSARLLVIGRSPRSEKEERIRRLEELGAEVLYVSADVGDARMLRQAVRLGEEAFGPIDGAVHAAGLVEGDSFALLDQWQPGHMLQQFQAKVHGLLALEEALAHRELAFRWLYSSISTVLGGLGFAGYAAANAFMDSFSLARRPRWLAVNWDGMEAADTISSFRRILAVNGLPQVAVSRGGDLDERLRRWVELKDLKTQEDAAPKPQSSYQPRPVLATVYREAQDDRMRVLTDIWQNLFGFAPIGIDDDFFELGGDSLKAISVISLIHRRLDAEVPLPEFFKRPTVAQLSAFIEGSAARRHRHIEPLEKREYYPLSSAQKRLYILATMDPGSIAYNGPQPVAIEGELDFDRMQEAFRALIRRHESLRSSIRLLNGEPVQMVGDHLEFFIERFIAKDHADAGQLMQRFIRPFDLAAAPFFRVGLVETSSQSHILVVDIHHIITDGVSHEIFVNDLTSLYEGHDLPPLTLQYRDYAVWQQNERSSGTLRKQEEYWRQIFATPAPLLDLPVDFPRPAIQSFAGNAIDTMLESSLVNDLKRLSSRHECTLFMMLLALFNLLLAKAGGQEDIVVGTGVAGRRHADLQDILGIFVNTLALRNSPCPDLSFPSFLRQVKERTLDGFDNQEFQFEDLVEALDVKRDTGRNPLFDTMLVLQNIASPQNQSLSSGSLRRELALRPFTLEYRVAKFDLTLFVQEAGDELHLTFEYCTALFEKRTVLLLASMFRELALAAVTVPDSVLKELGAMPPERKEAFLLDLNQAFPAEVATLDARLVPLQEMLARSFDRHEPLVALEQDDWAMTYGELNRRSAIVAARLLAAGATAGTPVAVMARDRRQLIITMIGIIGVRAVFVPLDPSLPDQRVAAMIAHTDPVCVAGDHFCWARLATLALPVRYKTRLLQLEERLLDVGDTEEPAHAELSYDGGDAIYIYFTSGSTGSPRGMVGRNHSLVHFLQWEIETFGVDRSFCFSQLINPGFDAFLRDVCVPLATGGRICIPRAKDVLLDPVALRQWVERSRIALMHCVPGLFRQLDGPDCNQSHYRTLRYILLSGERLEPSSLEGWFGRMGDRIGLVNLWGTSETTLAKTWHRIIPADVKRLRVPVGIPLPGTRVIVLDGDGRCRDLLTSGEMVIATPYRTFGYLNDPEATHDRFVPLPCANGASVACHKTGDLGRIQAQGTIDILGRNDRQVKIRGIRVELEEIESALRRFDGVVEAAVAVHETVLFGYIVPAQSGTGDDDRLREVLQESLAKHLPDYMIPQRIKILQKLPRTPNGKINYRELPDPNEEDGAPPEAPADLMEQTLLTLWIGILGRETIGVTENFFALGGNSLNVMTLISRIHRELDVRLPLAQVFNRPTIRTQAQLIRDSRQDRFAAIEPVEEMDFYPLSPAQKRLFILQQFEGDNTVYNMPTFLEIDGAIAASPLEERFAHLVGRHESLRTSFHDSPAGPVQRIWRQVPFAIQRFDAGNGPSMDEMVESFVRPFDLSEAPLLRVGLLPLPTGRSLLLIDIHHIVTDGVSNKILIDDFQALFKGQALPPLRLRYRDYSQWQLRQRQSGAIARQEQYWRERFEGQVPILDLPADFQRPEARDFAGRLTGFEIPMNVSSAIRALCRDCGASPFMFFLAVYAAMLARLGGEEDLVVGSGVAGRRHADLEAVVGMFVNMLPLRLDVDGELPFDGFLRQVKLIALQAFENQDVPFEDLVDLLSLPRDAGRNPLFDVVFMFHNEEAPDRARASEATSDSGFRSHDYEMKTAKFDLTLQAQESGGRFFMVFEYSVRLFKEATIHRFMHYFRAIAASVAANPHLPLAGIDLLPPEEKERLVCDFNRTAADFPRQKTIPVLFAETALKSPGSVALVARDLFLSYNELNLQANRLARRLKAHSAHKTGMLVGLMAGRHELAVCGVLGILQAGAAYVPLDPAYPASRTADIIADAALPIVLADRQAHADGILPHIKDLDLSFSMLACDRDESLDDKDLSAPTNPEDPAYVIYTSGSTGRPKGVVVEQRHVVRLLFNDRFPFDFDNTDVWTLFHSINFDFSVWELFGALLYGGRLVIVDENVSRDPAEFVSLLSRRNVTVLNQIPSVFDRVSAEAVLPEAPLLDVHTIIFGGEALHPAKLAPFHHKYPGVRLVNMYGITETTVHVTYKEIAGRDIEIGDSNAGRPIPTLHVYLMDKHQQLSPLGTTGEILVGGDGVARGYLNRVELTAQRFIDDPFRPGQRLYRSGDLGRYAPNGDIIYVGRGDRQVKIRGFRIECGEIEARLQSYPDVTEAVVAAIPVRDGENLLCAYLVVPNHDGNPTGSDLRRFLEQTLPHYMIPSFFVFMESLPRTSSGKLDRGALPHPNEMAATHEKHIQAPQTPSERSIAAIFAEVLGKEVVGIDENFFEIGGHSLKATQVLSRVHRDLQVKLPLKYMFLYPTVRELSKWADRAQEQTFAAIPRAEAMEHYPLSHGQKRLWILDKLEGQQTAYIMPGAYIFEGSLDRERLEETLRFIMTRHHSLRTIFVDWAGEPRQKIIPAGAFEPVLHFDDLRENGGEAAARDMAARDSITPFNLSTGPLFRSRLLRVACNRYIFLFTLHHIIADGWSMAILIDEVLSLYNQPPQTPEANPQLPPLIIQYADYSVWQHKQLSDSGLHRHREFWLDLFKGDVPVLELHTDKPRPAIKTFNGANCGRIFSKELTRKLQTLARRHGATLFMTLLSILYSLFHRQSGQTDIVIGSPIAGRHHKDLERQIGLYLNTLALRARMEPHLPFSRLLEGVKETALGAFEHQLHPFDLLVEQLHLKRDLSRSPLFDVLLVLQNQETGGKEGDGMSGVQVSRLDGASSVSKFDMTFYFNEIDDALFLQLNFNTDLFFTSRMERMAGYFETMAEAVVENPGCPLHELDYISPQERRLLLEEWNYNPLPLPEGRTLHRAVHRQAEKTPDTVALVCAGRHVTYATFSRWSCAIAGWLRQEYGVVAEDRIGFKMEKSEKIAAVILGIMTSGAAFVAVHPNETASRAAVIVADSNCKLVLRDNDIPGFLYSGSLDSHNEATDDSLAYVVYTSGSTGRPKGILASHRNIANFIYGHHHQFPLDPNWNFILTSELTFDASLRQIFLPLTIGAALHIIPAIERVDRFVQYLIRCRIDVLYAAPVLCGEILSVLDDTEAELRLRYLFSSGEALDPRTARRLKGCFTEAAIVHMYGPTETCMVASHYALSGTEEESLPIGRPLPNYTLFLLDDERRPVPRGVVGEIYIGGPGVSRGYQNNPTLTQRVILPDPFAGSQDSRMYRTGDRGVFLESGELRFLGRLDNQIKLRGIRVEPGEVESALKRHPEIREAVVLPQWDRGQVVSLAAFYLAPEEIPPSMLRQFLANHLAKALIPAQFAHLHSFPLTPSGKIDRNALPTIQAIESASPQTIEPPATDLEKKMTVIWKKVLGKKRLGATDNFFDLGGDSLKAIRLLHEIGRRLDSEPVLKDLFNYPTIRSYCSFISNGDELSRQNNTGFYRINNQYSQTCTIVCFPPMIGFAFDFHRLANLVQHPIYLFNMIYESMEGEPLVGNERLIGEFVRQMKGMNLIDPIILIGWSAGGKLAFEVCRRLEQTGRPVAKIIMIDANKIILKVGPDYIQNQLNKYRYQLKRAGTVKAEIEHSLGRMRRYYDFYLEVEHRGPIAADIHMIASKFANITLDGRLDRPNLLTEDTSHMIGTKYWRDLTAGSFIIHDGHGNHKQMLEPGFVDQNAAIINKIIFDKDPHANNQ